VKRPEEKVEPATRAKWRAWLRDNAKRTGGIWLVLHKDKGASLTYEAAVEEALAFGWIDSKTNKLDEHRYKIWIAPRKPGSGWSRLNKERVSRLIDNRRMTEAGMAAVERAKADGSWGALDSVQALELPPDLAKALTADSSAGRFFDKFPPSSKRIILEWIAGAKRSETRRQRIEETVRLAKKNIRAHHWRQPGSANWPL
jgi:uncharacterized protein YdeI (YjbR/CyaY-like superfamily)